MRLDAADARSRLEAHDHGVLATVHPERGVDAVPVVYAVVEERVAVPIDRVKPKATPRLQRERNLRADARATLLVEHWDAGDWSRLWWVRAELEWEADPSPEHVVAMTAALVERYPQYAGGPGRSSSSPFDRLLVLRILRLTGWAAS